MNTSADIYETALAYHNAMHQGVMHAQDEHDQQKLRAAQQQASLAKLKAGR